VSEPKPQPTEWAWLQSIIEVDHAVKPGIRIREEEYLVYEVRRLETKSPPILGKPRDLFIALHSGPSTAYVFLVLPLCEKQSEWVLTPEQITEFNAAFARRCPACRGVGMTREDWLTVCPACKGSGEKPVPDGTPNAKEQP